MTTEHNPLDLEGQERTAADIAAEERRQRDREANDLRYVMRSKEGRRFVYRQLSEAGVYRISFSPGMDAMTTAFVEGNRNCGVKMLNEIMEVCPERYTEMLNEQQEAKERDDNRNADTRNRTKR